MIKHNADNERIKREYFTFLKEAKRHGVETVDAAAMALARFESYTKYRDFKTFHIEQAIAFKKQLATQDSKVTKEKLSKATIYACLAQLKRFFQWLSAEPGYRSRLKYTDAEFFNLSEKDSRIATTRRSRPVPTLEQIRHVLASKTSAGGTDHVWFYDMHADGWSLDDKRNSLLDDDKLGVAPTSALSADDHSRNNLPDVLSRWFQRSTDERKRPRTAQSFCVPKAEIASQGYDLGVNRYKEVVHVDVAHRAPQVILIELAKLEAEIATGMKKLAEMLE